MFTRANGKHVYVALGETPSLMEHLSVNKALTESDFVRVGNSVMRVDEMVRRCTRLDSMMKVESIMK